MFAYVFYPQGSFPRVCGDVPPVTVGSPWCPMFSPRMRGCSGVTEQHKAVLDVFPAYAGMFLCPALPLHQPHRFPRVCGDVPGVQNLVLDPTEFSPRMRGCSEKGVVAVAAPPVFPAYAGMFR